MAPPRWLRPGRFGAGYEELLDTLAEVLGGLRTVLEPGRYLTVVIQNVRVPGGEV